MQICGCNEEGEMGSVAMVSETLTLTYTFSAKGGAKSELTYHSSWLLQPPSAGAGVTCL